MVVLSDKPTGGDARQGGERKGTVAAFFGVNVCENCSVLSILPYMDSSSFANKLFTAVGSTAYVYPAS